MSKHIQTIRGMNDALPPDTAKWIAFEARCRDLFERYGYREIRTPVLESTALFSRGIGEATDIVEKEMYTFPDRKGRSLTMRPEMTASCARAYIQHSLDKQEPVTRWYYIAPMFRYERSQVGRYRQFWQMGVEVFGIAEPSIDVEQMAMLHHLYSELGVPELQLLVNSVGDAADRPAYRESLVAFLAPHTQALCADCQRRLQTNPLRVLDCKVPNCKRIVSDAPSVLDALGDASRHHFDEVCRGLQELKVPHTVEPRLVRGLDYYTGTVFELVSAADQLGTQTTIVAGGRYNGLVESLGGPAVPGIGFAGGIERALLCMPGTAKDYDRAPELFVLAHGDASRAAAAVLAHQLRLAGLRVEVEHRSVGMKAQLRRAGKLGANLVAIIGEDELASGEVTLRDMQTREERRVPTDQLAQLLLAG